MGKIVLKERVLAKETRVNWPSNIALGNYILVVLKEDEIMEVIKLVKGAE